MQYAILIHESQEGMNLRNTAEAPAYWGRWKAFSEAVVAAGIMRGGAGLELPHTATKVIVRDGSRTVQDGPFADTKQQLGGFFLIEVDNLDQALDWARRVPVDNGGVVEVRPVLQMSAD